MGIKKLINLFNYKIRNVLHVNINTIFSKQHQKISVHNDVVSQNLNISLQRRQLDNICFCIQFFVIPQIISHWETSVNIR